MRFLVCDSFQALLEEKMKKKVLFVMSSLRNGGAERSLINLLQLFDYNLYDVDLLLFQQEGMFLNQLPKEVNLISENIKLHILYKTKSGGIIEWKHLLLSMLHVYATVCSKMNFVAGNTDGIIIIIKV